MKKATHDLLLRTVKSLNAILMTLPFAAAWFFYYGDRILVPYYRYGDWVILLLFLLLYVNFGKIYDAFLVSLTRITEMVYSQSLTAVISDFFMYVVTVLLSGHVPNPLPLLAALAGQFMLSITWSTLAHKWYFHTFPPKRTAVVYDMRQDLAPLLGEYGLEKKFHILLRISIDEWLEQPGLLDDMEVVFFSGIRSHDRNVLLKHCLSKGIDAYVIPRVGDLLMSSAKTMHILHLPILRVGRYNPGFFYLFAKRVFDIVTAVVSLVLLSPLFLITAIAIKACDGGPVFYKQVRLTKDGKRFHIHKFRSMRMDAEKDGVRLSSGESDPRVPPVGRVIRRFRIDELPQLFDVLCGSLSVVGPRPERPEIAEEYCKQIPEFNLRLQAKAGLTGYAQVYGKYNTTPYDKLQMDLMYIAHPSLIEDLRICFATVKTLFMPESTEGVEEGQTTAL